MKLLENIKHRLRHSLFLAGIWRRLMFRTKVIAITGSVGKTTCRELLVALIEQGHLDGGEVDSRHIHSTSNNENDAYGLPPVLFGIRPWHRFAVVEVSASGPGTLKRLSKAVRPDIAIVTAVAATHTKEYANIDAIAVEKSWLIRNMRKGGQAILNGDDERVVAMRELCEMPVILYGTGAGVEISASQVQASWPERLSFKLNSSNGQLKVQTQLVGAHWLSSALRGLTIG